MLARRIIPCLDVKDGRVVKGVNFLELRDAGDPVEIAQRYDAEGADEVTFLDITASHEERRILFDVVARTAETVFMPLTVGGGVRELRDVRELLNAGADKVAINTAAVQNPDFVVAACRRFGSQCIVVAIDAKRAATPSADAVRAGRCTPTVAAGRPVSMPSSGRGAWRPPAPARSCSPAWTGTARRRATTSS